MRVCVRVRVRAVILTLFRLMGSIRFACWLFLFPLFPFFIPSLLCLWEITRTISLGHFCPASSNCAIFEQAHSSPLWSFESEVFAGRGVELDLS